MTKLFDLLPAQVKERHSLFQDSRDNASVSEYFRVCPLTFYSFHEFLRERNVIEK